LGTQIDLPLDQVLVGDCIAWLKHLPPAIPAEHWSERLVDIAVITWPAAAMFVTLTPVSAPSYRRLLGADAAELAGQLALAMEAVLGAIRAWSGAYEVKQQGSEK